MGRLRSWRSETVINAEIYGFLVGFPPSFLLELKKQEIRKIRLDAKILFVSGYSPDLLHDRGILDSSEEVLVKPIHPLDLVRKVRAVLDSQSHT